MIEPSKSRFQRQLADHGITADAVLDRVMAARGLTQDAQLAELFEVSRPTIAAWRKRNRIPMVELLGLSFEGKLDFVDCLLGRELPGAIAGRAISDLELERARETFSRALRLIDRYRPNKEGDN